MIDMRKFLFEDSDDSGILKNLVFLSCLYIVIGMLIVFSMLMFRQAML